MSMNEVVEKFEAAKSDFATVEGFNTFLDAALNANNAVIAHHSEKYIGHMIGQVDMVNGFIAEGYVDLLAGVVDAVTPELPAKTGSSTLFFNGPSKSDSAPEIEPQI